MIMRFAILPLVCLFASVPLAQAFGGGPDPGLTGAPGEQTCVACHLGRPLNSGTGSLRIELPSGDTYVPGQRVAITVTLADPTARRWGFQLTARSSTNAQQTAGTLASTNNQTQVTTQGGRQYIAHTLTGSRNGTTGSVTFVFDWTAPAAGFGPVTFYAAGNAANGNGSDSGDTIYTTTKQVTPVASGGGGAPKPAFTSSQISEAWTGRTGVSPGAWTSIVGTDLAAGTATWAPSASRPLETKLGGVSVKVGDTQAAVSFVSPTRVTFLVPGGTPEGNVDVVVERDGTASDPVSVGVAAAVPAIQAVPDPASAGRFYAAVTPAGVGTTLVFVQPRGWIIGKPEVDNRAIRGAFPGEEIDIWATGLGRAEETPTDRIVSGSFAVVNPPRVRFAGVAVDPIAAGLVAPGVYIVRVRVPENQAPGDVALVLDSGGNASTSVLLNVQAAPQ
jgi:uncharacterized protein (TIGR03437 family)